MNIFFLALFFLIIPIIFIEVVWIAYHGILSKKLAKKTKHFSQFPSDPTCKILVLGDSIACGVGATEECNSLAGRLGSLYPGAYVTTRFINGVKVKKALTLIDTSKKEERWNLLVIFLGGMDIIHFTPRKIFSRNISVIFNKAKQCADKVVYVSPANVGLSPIFPFPFSLFYSIHSYFLLKTAKKIAAEMGIIYVDLFENKKNDSFGGKVDFYAPDLSHPNDEGYIIWFNKIKEALDNHFPFYNK